MKSAEAFLKQLGIEPLDTSEPFEFAADNDLTVSDEQQRLSAAIEARAVALLAIREHGAKELSAKLRVKFPETPELLKVCDARPGLVKALVDAVVKHCQKNNWQSDERYIEQAVRNWAEKGSGPSKIRQKLMQASHRDDLITAYLDWDESEWIELARAALLKKYGETLKPELRNEQAKRMRFLQSRGFSQSVIWKAFR